MANIDIMDLIKHFLDEEDIRYQNSEGNALTLGEEHPWRDSFGKQVTDHFLLMAVEPDSFFTEDGYGAFEGDPSDGLLLIVHTGPCSDMVPVVKQFDYHQPGFLHKMKIFIKAQPWAYNSNYDPAPRGVKIYENGEW